MFVVNTLLVKHGDVRYHIFGVDLIYLSNLLSRRLIPFSADKAGKCRVFVKSFSGTCATHGVSVGLKLGQTINC